MSFPGFDASEILYELDERGICASGGSACSSGETGPSHVLTAIGLPEELYSSAVRFSFGDFNTMNDVDYLIKSLVEIINKIMQQ